MRHLVNAALMLGAAMLTVVAVAAILEMMALRH